MVAPSPTGPTAVTEWSPRSELPTQDTLERRFHRLVSAASVNSNPSLCLLRKTSSSKKSKRLRAKDTLTLNNKPSSGWLSLSHSTATHMSASERRRLVSTEPEDTCHPTTMDAVG